MELTLKIKAEKINETVAVSVSLLEDDGANIYAHHQHKSFPVEEFSQYEYQTAITTMIQKCINKCR